MAEPGAMLDTHDSRRPIRCVNRLWNVPRVSPRCSLLPRNVRVQRAPSNEPLVEAAPMRTSLRAMLDEGDLGHA